MSKNKILLFTLIFWIYFIKLDAQNLLKYETKVITISTQESSNFDGNAVSYISTDVGRFVYLKNIAFGSKLNDPNSYELNNTIPANSNYSNVSNITVVQAIQIISNALNNIGYSLKSTITTKIKNVQNQQSDAIVLIFEKVDSYREEELYKLLGELNTKIDTTSKNYIERAKTEINQNVLEYLKGIPDEVLAKSFKEQLLKNLSIEIDDKLKKMQEEILLEIKKP